MLTGANWLACHCRNKNELIIEGVNKDVERPEILMKCAKLKSNSKIIDII